MIYKDVTEADIEAISESIGSSPHGWDLVGPKALVAAVVNHFHTIPITKTDVVMLTPEEISAKFGRDPCIGCVPGEKFPYSEDVDHPCKFKKAWLEKNSGVTPGAED